LITSPHFATSRRRKASASAGVSYIPHIAGRIPR